MQIMRSTYLARVVLSGILLFLFNPWPAIAQQTTDRLFTVSGPNFVLTGVSFDLQISAHDSSGSVDTTYSGDVTVSGVVSETGNVESRVIASVVKGRSTLENVIVPQSGTVSVIVGEGVGSGTLLIRSIPGVLSVLPPLLAIILALALRQVVLSLFAGVWLGALFVFDYNPFAALLRVVDHYVVGALADPDHAAIIVFTLLFGGMVGVISRNGGTLGIAGKLVTFANTPRRGQLATWVLGILIFFDDYANTLIVGNTMRPVTDKLRISREKLAYIVDATAAPVASVFFISSWIGYEVGLIDAAIKAIDYHVANAYWIFIDSIPFRFYPILALVLGLTIAMAERDFGPMLEAERRARKKGKLYRDEARLAADLSESTYLVPPDGIQYRWWNGALPVFSVVFFGIIGLYSTGYQTIMEGGGTDFSISNIIGSSDSYRALQWAALGSCVVAVLLSVSQRILTLLQAMDAWFVGVKSMLFAVLILLLAWSIGVVTNDLHTAEYLVQLLQGNLSPHWLPVLTFAVAALISFATGTSWGTMGILMPLVIPLTVALGEESGLGASSVHVLLLGSVSSVLAGAVAGDHCSPISDTTILSSTASACDHIDHVRTQLPYAIAVAIVGMLLGDIPTAFGISPYLSIMAGSAVVIGLVFVIGKRVGGE